MTRDKAIAELVRIWHSPHLDLSLKAGLAEAIETLKENNLNDALVRDEADDCKESESKLDLIRRADAIRWVKTECNPYGKPTLDFESGKRVMEHLEQMPSAEPKTWEWIPVSERFPECEQEVLICTEKKLVGKDAYIDSIITPAIYEDGTMLEVESMWSWYDIDFDEWDDTEDCGIIPMGWFENRHFNPDGVYNNPVDRKVVAWMTLPEPYKGGDDE